jgi:hypothetical protein
MKDAMYRDLSEEHAIIISFNSAEHNGTIDKRAENIGYTKQDLKWTLDIMREIPQDFREALVYLMKKMCLKGLWQIGQWSIKRYPKDEK